MYRILDNIDSTLKDKDIYINVKENATEFNKKITNYFSLILSNRLTFILETHNEEYNKILQIFGFIFIKPNILSQNLYQNNSDSDNNKKYLKIKMMCSWCSSIDLCKLWNKMIPDNSNIKLTDKDDADYFIIVNKPCDNSYYNASKTIVLRMEPDTETNYIWNNWYKSKKDFMWFLDLDKFRNNSEWHLEKTYDDLFTQHPNKTKLLSSIVSSLYFMEGHKFRIDFLKFIEDKINIDIYGKNNNFKFKNYICPLPPYNKNDGILPYKYTFISENCSMNNYFTEKIIDAILGECLCFYWGCKNIDDFIDKQAYIVLDETNFDKSFNIIKNAISNNEWEKRIDVIRKEKTKLLSHLSFYPRINSFISISDMKLHILFSGINLSDEKTNKRYNNIKCKLEKEGIYRYDFINQDNNEEGIFLNFNSNIDLCLNFIDHLCEAHSEIKEYKYLYLRNDKYINENEDENNGTYITRCIKTNSESPDCFIRKKGIFDYITKKILIYKK